VKRSFGRREFLSCTERSMKAFVLASMAVALVGCGGGGDDVGHISDPGIGTIGFGDNDPCDTFADRCADANDVPDTSLACASPNDLPPASAPELLTPETPTVRAVTLQWIPPTSNFDGTALTDLTGYQLLYRDVAFPLIDTTIVDVDPGLTALVIDMPWAGTWSFRLRSKRAAKPCSVGPESATFEVDVP